MGARDLCDGADVGKSTFRRICVAVLRRFITNTTLEATFFEKFPDADGPDVSVVSPHGRLHEFVSYLGSGYRAKPVKH